SAEPRSRIPKGVKIAVLAAVIVGSNAITFFMATRPPKTLLPPFRVMEDGPAERLLAGAAGDYVMSPPGERGMTIKKDSAVRWFTARASTRSWTKSDPARSRATPARRRCHSRKFAASRRWRGASRTKPGL